MMNQENMIIFNKLIYIFSYVISIHKYGQLLLWINDEARGYDNFGKNHLYIWLSGLYIFHMFSNWHQTRNGVHDNRILSLAPKFSLLESLIESDSFTTTFYVYP